jgi:hypothetical protein
VGEILAALELHARLYRTVVDPTGGDIAAVLPIDRTVVFERFRALRWLSRFDFEEWDLTPGRGVHESECPE